MRRFFLIVIRVLAGGEWYVRGAGRTLRSRQVHDNEAPVQILRHQLRSHNYRQPGYFRGMLLVRVSFFYYDFE